MPLQQILHIVRPTLKIIDQKLLLIENRKCSHPLSSYSAKKLSYKLIILNVKNVAVYEGRVLALGLWGSGALGIWGSGVFG